MADTNPTTDDYRKRYANALAGLTYDNASTREVRGYVDALLQSSFTLTKHEQVDPAQWVWAIENVDIKCKRCGGTGRFVTYVENGKPRGPGGPCFRCGGKGYQDHKDGHRNRVHDIHYINKSVV